ncbi:hypothetical protein CSB37_02230 [bacterium DOLZORAL124_38_8]|nr:MAG: hypothetical protein CSB37_02230 [bacterium DOLZORAL124_38_8]
MFLLKTIIEIFAFAIGLFGGLIIVVGVVKAAKMYIEKKEDSFFQASRLELSQHLLLGLDFLVAKDILDTLVLERNTSVLIHIVVLVGLRILLTHFVNKELVELKQATKRTQSSKKSFKKRFPKKDKEDTPKIIA